MHIQVRRYGPMILKEDAVTSHGVNRWAVSSARNSLNDAEYPFQDINALMSHADETMQMTPGKLYPL